MKWREWLIAFALGLMLSPAPAFGQSTSPQNKTQLQNNVTTFYPDNTSGLITPLILRNMTTGQINSWQQAPAVNARPGGEGAYTISVNDFGQLVTINNALGVAIALPQAIGTFANFNVTICNNAAGSVVITPAVSTIGGASSLTLAQNQCRYIVSDGTNYQTTGVGIQPVTCAASNWINAITGAGVPTCSQPAFTDISGTLQPNKGGSGTTTVPSSGQLLVGNAGGTAYAPQTMSGDATIASTGAITTVKINGISYPAGPQTVGTSPVVQAGGTSVLYQAGGGGGGITQVVYQTFCPSGCTTTIAGGATGTYTKTAGTVFAIADCVAGGGGGGGAAAAGGGFFDSGAGGGAGSWARARLTSAQIGTSLTVAIGTAGTAGAAGSNNGGAGGDSCFTTSTCTSGQLVAGKGGSGGSGAVNGGTSTGGIGGVSGTGDIKGVGMSGADGDGGSASTATNGHSGYGGTATGSLGGGGGTTKITSSGVTSVTGGAAVSFGGGGSGGGSYSGGAAAAGGAGFAGACAITEYVQ
jgi:hypothetical protein